MERNVILEGVVGSTAYGLAGPTSDQDHLGIYVASTDDVLGLDGNTAVDHSDVTHDPEDRTLHEIGKYLKLALQCNPTIMELLWLPSWTVTTPEGMRLVSLRKAVLSTARVRDAYGGYALQQAKRLTQRHAEGREGFAADLGKRTAKHGRHCARLLLAGRHLLKHGELLVDVSAHREYLFGMGELAVSNPIAFQVAFEMADEHLKNAAAESVLPEEPDRATVNQVLVDIRRNQAL